MIRPIGLALACALAAGTFAPRAAVSAPEKPPLLPLAELRKAVPEISAALKKTLEAEPESESLKAAAESLARLAQASDAAMAATVISNDDLQSLASAREAEARRRVEFAQALRDADRLVKSGQKAQAIEGYLQALKIEPGNAIALKRIEALDPAEAEKLPPELKSSIPEPGSLAAAGAAGERLRGDLRSRVTRMAGEGNEAEALGEIRQFESAEPVTKENGMTIAMLRARIGSDWIAKELPIASRLLRSAAEAGRSPELSPLAARLEEIAARWEEARQPPAGAKLESRQEAERRRSAVQNMLRSADIDFKNGRHDQAIRSLKEALAIDPENAIVQTRLRLMEEISKQQKP